MRKKERGREGGRKENSKKSVIDLKGINSAFIVCFSLFRAAPAAYGGSHAGIELELQLPAYTTATAMQDPSHIFDLRHSSWQRGQGSMITATSWFLVGFVSAAL